MITSGNLYDDYDADGFDETTEELAYRLPRSYISPEVDLDDSMSR